MTRVPTVDDVLLVTRRYLADPTRWTKHTLGAPDGPVCLLGGLNLAMSNGCSVTAVTDAATCELAAEVYQRLRGTGALERSGQGIARFNDHLDTTHADVLDLLDRAIAVKPTLASRIADALRRAFA